ncbi:MAG: hypothetical protein NUV49_01900 [Patescibacteria group bacterium]|nr:hypothetical protein [Patescibacteria group bacterium]
MEENTQNPSSSGAGQQEQKKEHNTVMAVVAYILFFIPLLTDAKNDPFVKYHVKQGLVLFIAYVVVMILSWTPIVWSLYGLIMLLNLGLLVLLIIGIMHAVNGEQKPLPFIGKFADKINI